MKKSMIILSIFFLVFFVGCKSEFPFQETIPEPISSPSDLESNSPNPVGEIPVIIYFRALKHTICVGDYVTLKLKIENATYAEILPLVGEISHFDGENEKRIYDIQENIDFTLTLKNEYGETSRTVNVYVEDCAESEAEVILVGNPHWTNGGGKKNPWIKVAGNVENIGDAMAVDTVIHIRLYYVNGTLSDHVECLVGDLPSGDNVHWSFKWDMKPEDLWDGKDKDLTSFEVAWL